MAKGKKQRIRLESQIQRLLHKDNGVTAHFDYKIHMNSNKNTVELNLLTFNPIHDDYMLLHTVSGKSSIECLKDMLMYLRAEAQNQKEYSFTVSWKKKGTEDTYLSYFRGHNEEEVLSKFLHEKKSDEYEFSVKVNPIT